jgi:hypothetical protein
VLAAVQKRYGQFGAVVLALDQRECRENGNWVQWTMRARPGLLAIRADVADEESLRRIQDLLTARLQKFGRREHLTVSWHRPAQAATDP